MADAEYSQPFVFGQETGVYTNIYDDVKNAIAFQGGGFAIYRADTGVPAGGLNIPIDLSQRNFVPNILAELLDTTPVWVWFAAIIIGIIWLFKSN